MTGRMNAVPSAIGKRCVLSDGLSLGSPSVRSNAACSVSMAPPIKSTGESVSVGDWPALRVPVTTISSNSVSCDRTAVGAPSAVAVAAMVTSQCLEAGLMLIVSPPLIKWREHTPQASRESNRASLAGHIWTRTQKACNDEPARLRSRIVAKRQPPGRVGRMSRLLLPAVERWNYVGVADSARSFICGAPACFAQYAQQKNSPAASMP